MDAGRVVLVVDDDASTREAARLVLEDEGYVVDVAGDGRAALARLRAVPTPSLVLLDLMMPGMDGGAFLRELEESVELPRVPVVVMTASNATRRTSSVEYPMLRKPFGLDELLKLVTTYCPRLWDDEEPTTEESSTVRERGTVLDETSRDRCAVCGKRAAARCASCGGAFCKGCIDPGRDAAVARCVRCAGRARV